MKTKVSKTKMAILGAAALLSVPASVMAASTTVSGSAKFLGAIALTPTAMAFGNITYAATPGASDTVVLKTDGTLTYNGTFANGGGTKAAGNVHAVGATGNAVSVYCDTQTTLGNGSGVTIKLGAIKVAKTADVATGGVACAGLGTAAYSTYTLTAADDFKIGATIDGSAVVGTWASGTYTTTLGAGDVNVVILYN